MPRVAAVPRTPDAAWITYEPTTSPDAITLTIARPSTTYTTTIPRGAAPTASPAAVVTSTAPTTKHEGPSNAAIGGAAIGSILGLILVVVLLFCCCSSRRERAERRPHWSPKPPPFSPFPPPPYQPPRRPPQPPAPHPHPPPPPPPHPIPPPPPPFFPPPGLGGGNDPQMPFPPPDPPPGPGWGGPGAGAAAGIADPAEVPHQPFHQPQHHHPAATHNVAHPEASHVSPNVRRYAERWRQIARNVPNVRNEGEGQISIVTRKRRPRAQGRVRREKSSSRRGVPVVVVEEGHRPVDVVVDV